VRAARAVPAQRRPGPVSPAARRGRMGHELREQIEPRRRLCALSAREDRPPLRTPRDRDREARRVPPPRGRRMKALPIRVRLTMAFALAMALVLAAMGAFVYVRVSDALVGSVDDTLRAQAREAGARLAGRG